MSCEQHTDPAANTACLASSILTLLLLTTCKLCYILLCSSTSCLASVDSCQHRHALLQAPCFTCKDLLLEVNALNDRLHNHVHSLEVIIAQRALQLGQQLVHLLLVHLAPLHL